MRALWGIDLGGTKIEGVVFEPDRHESPLARLRVPTEAHKGYPHIVAQCAALIAELELATGLQRPRAIGFGTPGSRDPATGKMRNCNTVCLNGATLQEDLSEAIDAQALVTNDANCFALAETVYGSAKGASCVFGVILGTGVGGGVVIDGKVWSGNNGIAGEWGHNVIEPEGEPCYCGHTGCVETVISGPALEKHYDSLAGERLAFSQIVERSRTDRNGPATMTVQRLVNGLAQGLAQVVNVLDPEVVVIGGGVGQTDEIYTEGTQRLKEAVFHEKPALELKRPLLGDSAGVFGAALQVLSRADDRP